MFAKSAFATIFRLIFCLILVFILLDLSLFFLIKAIFAHDANLPYVTNLCVGMLALTGLCIAGRLAMIETKTIIILMERDKQDSNITNIH